MATVPQYAVIPSVQRSCTGALSAANTGRDGTGTIVSILVAGAAGTRIDDLCVTALATTTVGMIRLYISDGGAVNNYLFRELNVPAVVPSATVSAWATTLYDMGLILQPGWSLRASTEKAELFRVSCLRWGDM